MQEATLAAGVCCMVGVGGEGGEGGLVVWVGREGWWCGWGGRGGRVGGVGGERVGGGCEGRWVVPMIKSTLQIADKDWWQ